MKSDESNLLEVAVAVYRDATAKCTADVSDLRDLDTLRARVKCEGISFLTITLPAFCKDFEKSLANGCIDSTCFRSFKKHGAIPAFMQGMLSQLFDQETGRYVQQTTASRVSATIIVECVRQICLTFKKIELPCTENRVQEAISKFVEVERDFEVFNLSEQDIHRFCDYSALLWDNLIGGICLEDFVPKHGPGATADARSGNRKYVWRSWTHRLEPYFPLVDNAFNICAMGSEELEEVTMLSECDELPVKVITVPKTLKSPRIIAIEPCCMQYIQQGIRSTLYRLIESSELVGGQVNFTDQTINQNKALTASKNGLSATIDLSEASDRVPLSLAACMFNSNPIIWEAILSCRSTHAKLPDGTVIGPLKKFASMGSALCFPLEAMYFYTICVMSLMEERNLPKTFRNIARCCKDVFVYGDDIIVPSEHADAVLVNLQKYNCKVNTSKTFLTGMFRESCGVDAFDGELVTPTYLRKMRPKSRRDSNALVSWCETANLFYKKGYWQTASLMFDVIEAHLGPLPFVHESDGYLGRISFRGARSLGNRWNERYQALEIRAWVPEPVYRTDPLEGYAALQKSLSKLTDLKDLWEERDPLHLQRSARHGVVTLKRRWILTS